MLPTAVALPSKVETELRAFVDSAVTALGDELVAVVLFGSAAEGRMRATSDVNVIVVLRAFDPVAASRLAPSLLLARAAIQMQPMFLLESEVTAAAEAFAPKFADVVRRHVVLHGRDVFASLVVPRSAQILHLRQVLLNLAMRLRVSFVERAGREEQRAVLAADTAGPLRAYASTLLQLESGTVLAPKEALQKIAEDQANAGWLAALQAVSDIRERRGGAERASDTVVALLEICEHLRQRSANLA